MKRFWIERLMPDEGRAFWSPSLAVCLLIVGMTACGAVAADGVGTLSVRVMEGDALLPCRAWVEAAGIRRFTPNDVSCTPYKKDESFSCDGVFVMDVPAGPVSVHLERGKEYHSVEREVVVRANETKHITILLRRWIDMQERGWYSGDLHVHFGKDDLRVLRQLALADDVNFLPAFTYWNDFRKEWPTWEQGAAIFADAIHLITLDNEEIERIGGPAFHSVGAPFIFGLDRPVYVDRHDKTFPADAALCRLAKATSPQCVIDTDKPLWAENVVGIALGLFDSVQLCHNHYHRRRTMGPCCGMIGLLSDLESQGQDELFRRTNAIYYQWLNCGFRLAVSGGSAMGVMPVPLGYNRTYVKVEGALTEAGFLNGLRAGRTFATSGPMLFFEANGKLPGDTIRLGGAKKESISLTCRLKSIQSLESLELLHNGKVVHRVDLKGKVAGPILEFSMQASIQPRRSGWAGARIIFRERDGRLRQAHTSPIYISVDGKPTAHKADAEFMIRWIDRLFEVSDEPDRYRSLKDRAEVQLLYQEAREVYENVARVAKEIWND